MFTNGWFIIEKNQGNLIDMVFHPLNQDSLLSTDSIKSIDVTPVGVQSLISTSLVQSIPVLAENGNILSIYSRTYPTGTLSAVITTFNGYIISPSTPTGTLSIGINTFNGYIVSPATPTGTLSIGISSSP